MAAQAAVQLKFLMAKNLKEGEAFLAENAKKDGIHIKEVTVPDGTKAELQYKISLQSGPPGLSPKKTDITVEIHYV